MLAGDRVIARAHNGLNAYLLSCNIVKYLCPLAIGGKGLLADKTAYLTDNITEKSSLGQNPWTNVVLVSNKTEQDQTRPNRTEHGCNTRYCNKKSTVLHLSLIITSNWCCKSLNNSLSL